MPAKIIGSCPRLGDYVFSSMGIRPFENFGREKKEMDRLINSKRPKHAVPFAHWTLHDLRRTAASGMAKLKVSPHIIENILNHSSGIISGVAAVYNRHDYLQQKQEALNVWNEHLNKLVA